MFLTGGGQAGELIRKTDWKDTPLGDPETWPDALKTALNIGLNSGFPIAIYWGREFTILYNDAYSSIPGDKHPWAMGKAGSIVWQEIWHLIAHQFNDVLKHGESVRMPDSMLPMKRFGYVEECYFDYTLSPIIDSTGKTRGIFNAVIETTYKVLNERRNKLLHALSAQAGKFTRSKKALGEILTPLTTERDDIPFALLYVADPLTGKYKLTQAVNCSALAFDYDWKVEQAVGTGKPQLVKDLDKQLPGISDTGWAEPCCEAVLLPLTRNVSGVDACLVAGVHPGKR
ncbi:MAG: hypothetical protein EOO05_12090, partial [Chitinophagaceae bacterium]